MIGSFVLLAVRGLNLGIDFTGGVVIEVSYPAAADIDRARDALAAGRLPGRSGAVLRQFARSGRARACRQQGEDVNQVSARIARSAESVDPGVAGAPHGSRRSAGRRAI